MSQSYKMFNTVLLEWFRQLKETVEMIDLEEEVKTIVSGKIDNGTKIIKAMAESKDLKANRIPLNAFMKGITPYIVNVNKKDEKLFTVYFKKMQYLNILPIDIIWAKLPDESREGMWQIINNLLMIGTIVKVIPENQLHFVEEKANQLCTNLKEKGVDIDSNDIDFDTVLEEAKLLKSD